jgi:PAS domain S-box-containing protein
MARLVDRYLDQAARALDSVARVAEITPPKELVVFMQGIREAYGYFDTLYYLDERSRITLLVPLDPRYQGLDMSNLSYFQKTGEENHLIISRPFISLRTGNPTVYLVRQLLRGGRMIGELSLKSLQDEVIRSRDANKEMIFIMDQSGMLLSHLSFKLVRQQTNQSHLEIFRRGLGGDTTLVYEYAGTMVLGSTARVKLALWVVVIQTPVAVSLRPYTCTLGLSLMASLVVWFSLTWSLRFQLQQRIAVPLAKLSRGTDALANGNFSQGRALASLPAAFVELTTLAADFQSMSDALEARQAALQESRERYHSLFERVPVALFRTASTGEHLNVNSAYIRMLGYPDRKTLLKVNAADYYLNPKDCEQWRAIAERDRIVWNFKMQLRRFDGTVMWTRVTAKVVRNSKGETLYYEGSIEDISDRKQAEEEIRRLNQELEQRVLDRTAELAAANKELEAFASSVSHDLRAPLRHINGFMELLQKSAVTTDKQERYYMTAISEAARKMGLLIDDLLSFSRMDRYALSFQKMALEELVRDILHEFGPNTAGRTIHWRIGDLPVVRGDGAMLRIVLVNLISNALKFTRFRQKTQIEIDSLPGRALEVVICVRDNGVGFDMAYGDKLFGVFQRLHRMDKFEGTGIGLANVRRIIARHGGRTWAEGEPDQGAAFYFSLPHTIQREENEKS